MTEAAEALGQEFGAVGLGIDNEARCIVVTLNDLSVGTIAPRRDCWVARRASGEELLEASPRLALLAVLDSGQTTS